MRMEHKWTDMEKIIESKDKEIKILREALEFYGDEKSWECLPGQHVDYINSIIRTDNEELERDNGDVWSYWCGGRRARQILAEIDKMKEV